MIPYINIEFTAKAREMIVKLERFPQTLMPAMRRGIVEGAQEAAGRIQAERLTGLGPFPVEEHMLGVLTGRLRQSVRVDAGNIEGDTVSASIGTNVRYAAAHEFGFEGDVFVRPFFRKNRLGDQFTTAEQTSRTTGRRYRRKVKTASGISSVRGHTRHMNIPARSPFGYGIADSEALIMNAVTSQLEDAWNAVQ